MGLPDGGPVSETGNGRHYFFRRPEGWPQACTTHNGASGKIDVLSGGYAILPPSNHLNGKSYTWLKPPGDTLPDPPSWALELLLTTAKTGGDVPDLGPEPTPTEAEAVSRALWQFLPERARDILEGAITTEDRSGQAYELARLAVEAGIKDPWTVAALVLGSQPHRGKFAGRKDAWVDACRIAGRSLEGQAPEPEEPQNLLDSAMPFYTWLDTGVEAEPLWTGLIHRGAVHLLAAPTKTGKTRFLADLLGHLTGPEEFVIPVEYDGKEWELKICDGTYWGRAFRGCLNVLIISEESPSAWRTRPPLGRQTKVIPMSTARRAGADALADIIKQNLFDLVVIDTLDKFWNVTDENDNQQIINAIQPLLDATHTSGTALLLVHHHRKSGGRDGEEIRGGTALLGAVDTYLDFCKTEGSPRERKIKVISRYETLPGPMQALLPDLRFGAYMTPQELKLEEKQSSAEDTTEVEKDTSSNMLLEALREHGPMFLKDLCQTTGVAKETGNKTLQRLKKRGLIECVGKKWHVK